MVTSRQFQKHVGEAKKAADKGSIFVTDRGTPAHALLNITENRTLAVRQPTVTEALAQRAVADIDFEPPRAGALHRDPEVD